MQLAWELGQLLDAVDASAGPAFTTRFVCRLRAHERPPSVDPIARYIG
jgi:hypothetical protein